MKAFRTVLPYLRKNIWYLVGGMTALLAVDFLQLIIPQIIKWVIDDLTRGGGKSRTLLIYGLEIIGIALLIGIFRFAWRYLILGTAHRIEQNLRLRLFTHLQTLPLNFFNRFSTGDIMAHATNDMNAIRMALGMALVALVDGVILSLMTVGFMIHINLQLTLYALIPAPFLIFITNRLSTLVHDRFLRIQETFSLLTEKVRENIAGIRVVKSYVQENHRLENLQKASNQLVRRNMELTRVWGLFFPLLLGIINLSLAIVIMFGGRQTILLTITPGDFVAFISYLGILTWPLIALGWVMSIFQRGAASMKRINNLLEIQPESTNSSHPDRMSRVSGKIEFRNISFSYEGYFPVLKNINLMINPGDSVAIVGRVGSGKTTILNLLFRLYEVKEGSIFIDGQDIQSIPLEKLRRNIGFVPQDTFLFSDTIKENIRFGSPPASREKIVTVSRIARIYDEIMSFPHQFETVVGEKGVTLSGGQKQRIAIARALLVDTPILILDNGLSSVDAQTEEMVMANLRSLVSGKTTIIVTHRISSIKNADCIYVLDNGEIREQGDHKTLLTLGGLYSEMFRRQQIEEELDKNNSMEPVDNAK
ncbi:MAG: ABC transporter ATP-binding protein [Proteobacteria bacterium]|nr:ABC transporter ATP-binding protein [Pseudomonadota bacterium]